MASARSRAFGAAAIGALSAATLPIAIVVANSSASYTLLQAGLAVPFGLLLGVVAIRLAGSVRTRSRASLDQRAGLRAAGAARLLGVLGVCLACSGAVALAVYALLTRLE